MNFPCPLISPSWSYLQLTGIKMPKGAGSGPACATAKAVGSTGTPERRSPRSCLLCFPPFPLPFSPVSPFLPLTLLFSHKHASGNSCVSYLGWDLGLSKVLVRHFLVLVSYVSGFMLYPGRAVRHNVLLFYFTCVCLDVCVCACAPCVCLRSEDSTGFSGTRVTGFMRHCAVLDTEPMSSGRTVRALDH